MTNAEKYLKDGVDEDEFVKELHYFWWANEYDVCEGISKFLHTQAKKPKPTLTEDERVILRNLRYEKGAYEYTKIGRTDLDSEGNCDLILIDSDDESVWWGEYGHLFQFIKERRRILYRGTVERRIKIMKSDDYFYVLFCTENAQFLMPNGETTQRLLEAERFETIKEAKENKQILDEPKDFIIFKVKAEYWLKRA